MHRFDPDTLPCLIEFRPHVEDTRGTPPTIRNAGYWLVRELLHHAVVSDDDKVTITLTTTDLRMLEGVRGAYEHYLDDAERPAPRTDPSGLVWEMADDGGQ